MMTDFATQVANAATTFKASGFFKQRVTRENLPSWTPRQVSADLLPVHGQLNAPLLKATAKWMREHPEHFGMSTFSCNTAACIGGTANLLINPYRWWVEGADTARVAFQFTYYQSQVIFFGRNHEGWWDDRANEYGWLNDKGQREIDQDDIFTVMERHSGDVADILDRIASGDLALPRYTGIGLGEYANMMPTLEETVELWAKTTATVELRANK